MGLLENWIQRYLELNYPMTGVNEMWILKISKNLLEHIQSSSLPCSSITIYDLSTLYTTLKTYER
jgi:hypothetical protein